MGIKIIIAGILCNVMIALMLGAFNAIKNNDEQFAVICAYGASLIGFMFGFCLGSICFGG